jgi:uncharacterized protein YciI
MPYMIDTQDKQNTQALRKSLRDNHLNYLKQNQSLLLACGAKLAEDGVTGLGSFYIVDVDTREEAEQFINSDPYMKGGLFEGVRVVRWRKSYLDGKSYL